MVQMLRKVLDNYLSVTAIGDTAADAGYAYVLAWKGSTLARQQRTRLARTDPKLTTLFQEMGSTTAELARLSAARPDGVKSQADWSRKLHELSEHQEQLEREAGKNDAFRLADEQSNPKPAELLKTLPVDAVLVDFLVYRHIRPDQNKKGPLLEEQRLTCFVLRSGAAIVRLDLGPIEPIEKAIDRWRVGVNDQPGKDHPGIELRRRLWLPLEKHLAGAKTVLVSPHGALGRLPLSALPGTKPGSYLLEEIALSVVPAPGCCRNCCVVTPPRNRALPLRSCWWAT